MRPSGGWGIDGIKKENTTAYLFYPVCSLGYDWCSGDFDSCTVAVFRRDRDRMDSSGKLWKECLQDVPDRFSQQSG